MKLVGRLLIGKDGILMSDMMIFPDTWEEFEKSYGFTDNEEIYTNGARLIPSFRVKQWLDHLPSIQPRKGKWIETDRWDEVCDILCECSECHSFVLVEEDYKYCPYCGADMREGDAE